MTTTTIQRLDLITVTWNGDELESVAFDDEAFEQRIAALLPHTQTGENFIRGVAECIREARRCRENANRYEPDLFFACRWLDEAEITARVIDHDTRNQRRDDRERAWRACSARSVAHMRSTGSPYGYNPKA